MPAENGYVPTPAPIADLAAANVFAAERPSEVDDPRLLLPGLGTGNLYDAVVRYCTPGKGRPANRSWDYPLPECVGVENDPELIGAFRMGHQDPAAPITVRHADFLLDPPDGPFDWVLANPPFMRYRRLDEAKRDAYRERFDTAQGQFPLYAPFVEQMLELVKAEGWVVTILPIKALRLSVTEPLQELLASKYIAPILYLPPQTFDRQIETVLIGVQDRPWEPTREHPFWVEPVEVYTSALRELLAALGVDDVDAALEHYDDMLSSYEQTLRGYTTRGMLERILAKDPSERGPDRRAGRDDGRTDGEVSQATLTGDW